MSLAQSPFDTLNHFLSKRMRMSHIYQPLMLKVLIEKNGWASIRDIALAFLVHDETQVDYYAEITKKMPGRVLASHGLVQREADGFRLLADVDGLSAEQRGELLRLCADALDRYRKRRGDRIYDHRRTALGDVSGTDRYEILKRAGFRCELCGVPADERSIEVDHILPRRHGGTDDRANLQALCYKCNANKGARDATDFRAIRAEMVARQSDCIFCNVAGPIVAENVLAVAIRDRFPVTLLHTLVSIREHLECLESVVIPLAATRFGGSC